MQYSKIYYYNQYAPNKILRRKLSRLIYDWSTSKYNPKDSRVKWQYWMDIKNKIFWTETPIDKLAKLILK